MISYKGEYLARNNKLIKCPVCGKATLKWENWGEVRAKEEEGIDEPLRVVCASCGSIFGSDEIGN